MNNRAKDFVKSLFISLSRFVGVIGKARAVEEADAVAETYVNSIVSDAIPLNETPSPTKNEEQRAQFVARRLGDFGISNVKVDGMGNVVAQ